MCSLSLADLKGEGANWIVHSPLFSDSIVTTPILVEKDLTFRSLVFAPGNSTRIPWNLASPFPNPGYTPACRVDRDLDSGQTLAVRLWFNRRCLRDSTYHNRIIPSLQATFSKFCALLNNILISTPFESNKRTVSEFDSINVVKVRIQ